MVRQSLILLFFIIGLLSLAHSQAVPSKKESKEKKEIKNVPSAGSKSKPAKITSSARPGSIKPNQPIRTGKPPAKVKPPGAGKPPGK